MPLWQWQSSYWTYLTTCLYCLGIFSTINIRNQIRDFLCIISESNVFHPVTFWNNSEIIPWMVFASSPFHNLLSLIFLVLWKKKKHFIPFDSYIAKRHWTTEKLLWYPKGSGRIIVSGGFVGTCRKGPWSVKNFPNMGKPVQGMAGQVSLSTFSELNESKVQRECCVTESAATDICVPRFKR